MHWQATTGNLLHLLTFLQNMSTKKMVLTIQLMLTASFSLLMQHQCCLHLKHLRHIHNNTASHHLTTLYLGKIYLLLLLIPVLLHRTRIQQDSKATDARREYVTGIKKAWQFLKTLYNGKIVVWQLPSSDGFCAVQMLPCKNSWKYIYTRSIYQVLSINHLAWC